MNRDSTPAAAGPRVLAHVDMDAFYASVEVLDRPELAGKPVIVGGLGRRGVVSAASYAARRFGVRSAMPGFQAQKLCPQGIFLPPRMDRYIQVSRQVMAVLESFSPILEQVSVDEAYLDLTGTAKLWGPPAAAGRLLKDRVRQTTGLTCSVGIAPQRFLAKIASERDKPDGLKVVDDLESFLATITLREVPGVGPRAQEKLRTMGLERLVQVRLLDPARLEAALGKWGLSLWNMAWGRGRDRLETDTVVKSLSHEITLSEDTASKAELSARLLGLARRVAARLRRRGLAGQVVTLKLKDSRHRLLTRSHTLEEPTDHSGEIHRAAVELLHRLDEPGPFRLVGVGVAGLSPVSAGQGALFGREAVARRRRVDQAEDLIVGKFGGRALVRAGELDLPPDPGPHKPTRS